MMKGTTVETVTIAGASFNPPTLLGNDGSTPGNYMNDHPVGPSANPGCGGPYNWDCTVSSDGSISFTGPNGKQFIADYYDVTKGSGPLAKHRESARNEHLDSAVRRPATHGSPAPPATTNTTCSISTPPLRGPR